MVRVVISTKCSDCARCAEACPMGCFHSDGEFYVINPEECIDCGVCEEECTDGSIVSDSEAPEEWIEFNREKSKEWPST